MSHIVLVVVMYSDWILSVYRYLLDYSTGHDLGKVACATNSGDLKLRSHV